MQDIDNNMDDLFRKAAASYPLKTDVNGWDKISPLLLDVTPVTSIPGKTGKYKLYSSLLILLAGLLLIGTSTILYNKNNGNANRNNYQVNGDRQQKHFSETKYTSTSNIKNGETPVTGKQTTDANTGSNSVIYSKTIANKQLGKKHLISTKKNAIAALYQTEEKSTLATDELINKNTFNEIPKAQNVPSQIKPTLLKSSVLLDNKKEKDQTDLVIVTDVIKTLPSDLEKLESPKKTDNAISNTNKIESVKDKKASSKFYIGAIAGISFNQVKKQGFQKPGYNIGLLAGYQFTKHLSVETGLIFEQKYYNSKGEYFDMSKLASTMPVGMQVISLKSSFAIFELPLNFKYNFNNRIAGGHFYTTAGISTYLSSKEFNQYKTLLNGTESSMTGTYNNVSHYTAASLNISFGYQKNISRSARVSIEPYIQLPLKGIGVGSLPVTTAGIHLGLFRIAR